MKWEGRQGSDNVEDRRRMGTGRKVAIGGGVGTLLIALVVLLLGGDPTSIVNMQPATTGSGTTEFSEEEEKMVKFVSVVLNDTETIWGKIFQEGGQVYREPKLVLFSGQVASACGYASATSGPFYCPGDEKVYIDLNFFAELQNRLGAQGDFAVAYVIAHEIGHHVQNLLGILDEVNSQRRRLSEVQANQLLVRLELQADFLSGVWAHYADRMLNILEMGDAEEAMNAAASVGDDVLQRKYQGRIYPDSFTHGTAAQRKEWFLKGFQTGNLNQGDTFSANL